MIRTFIRACLGGKMKFYTNKWNGYVIEAGHYKENKRSIPILWWLPYFWDSEIIFDLGVRTPGLKRIEDTWVYHWELRNLDGQIVKQGNEKIQGENTIHITNKGFRRNLRVWTCGKARAFVLSSLRPHREYILYANFTDGSNNTSDLFKIAAFSVADRGTYEMQLLLVLITIVLTLYFSAFAKACGM